ncbi:hypothetical protein VMCG_10663 [Cytospora schulzeri]|uniref:Rhodopsin domain-containing protein n=1 Tax=Cytospora schulzeri TaxID=448051 RepID=A0A423V8N0_9PEZI|nr:hypothetical protein VMCG_10663 [Valsa malicola]
MAVDAKILAIFGPPPAGTDLSADSTPSSNAACTVFFVIAALCVALRFYVRMGNDTVGRDDYTMLAGLISSAALLATTILAGQQGAGQHIVYAEPFVYAVAVTTTKISILLLYRRLFHAGQSTTNRIYAATFWTAVALTSCYPVIMFVTMAAACRPVSFYWTQYLGETGGTCIDVTLFYLVFGIVNMVVDVVILLSPIPRINSLQLNKRKKFSVMAIMLLGSFVCVASMIRIYYLDQLAYSVDATWWMGPGMAWSSIEPSVAIISACLPTFAPLLRMGGGNTRRGVGSGYDERLPGSALRYGAHRATATRAALKSEDEVELTRAGRCRDRYSSSNLSSGHGTSNGGGCGGGGGGGIVVDTEVRVSSEQGPL